MCGACACAAAEINESHESAKDELKSQPLQSDHAPDRRYKALDRRG